MCNIQILSTGDEARLEVFLLPQIDSSMFLLGNMRQASLMDDGQRYSGCYAAYMKDNQITGVAAHYWNGNLICQAPVEQVAGLCRAAVEVSARPIHGVIGPAAQVGAVQQTLGIAEGFIQMDAVERLYTLQLEQMMVPDALSQGLLRARPIAESDLPLLIEWRNGYSIESLYAKPGPELTQQSRSGMEQSLREGTGWILEAEGKPVSYTDFNAVLPEARQVGGVWTPPEFRSRGYARAAVAASLLAAREGGTEKAILFTGEENTPAQKAYQSLGFRQIGDYRLLILNRPFSLRGSR